MTTTKTLISKAISSSRAKAEEKAKTERAEKRRQIASDRAYEAELAYQAEQNAQRRQLQESLDNISFDVDNIKGIESALYKLADVIEDAINNGGRIDEEGEMRYNKFLTGLKMLHIHAPENASLQYFDDLVEKLFAEQNFISKTDRFLKLGYTCERVYNAIIRRAGSFSDIRIAEDALQLLFLQMKSLLPPKKCKYRSNTDIKYYFEHFSNIEQWNDFKYFVYLNLSERILEEAKVKNINNDKFQSLQMKYDDEVIRYHSLEKELQAKRAENKEKRKERFHKFLEFFKKKQ